MEAYPPPQPLPAPQPAGTNVFGLIGLIASILGFFVLITAPIGLILSLIGLRHPEKGLAIAGTIVGALATIYAVVIAVFFGVYVALLTTFCCGITQQVGSGISAISEELTIEKAVRSAVAKELNKASSQVELREFDSGNSGDKPRRASGVVVWQAEGKRTARRFECTVAKQGEQWEATELEFTGKPFEWTEPQKDRNKAPSQDRRHPSPQPEAPKTEPPGKTSPTGKTALDKEP